MDVLFIFIYLLIQRYITKRGLYNRFLFLEEKIKITSNFKGKIYNLIFYFYYTF